MFCMLYAMIGIPLLVVFTANIGDLMADGFRWLYSRICCRWCRVRRRDAELPPSVERDKEIRIQGDELGKETYMPTDKVNVPIMVNLMLIFGFLFLGAMAFSSWEDWDLGTALYFSFVTLTTIGFGDKWPEKSFLNYADGIGPFMQMMVTVVYSIFGKMGEKILFLA
jgi:potassium channel subfamily K protein